MTIQTFIEKAIEGEWKPRGQQNSDWRDKEGVFHSTHVDSIFLDPEAWKAVGKMEEWYECGCRIHADAHQDGCGIVQTKVWLNKMHRMIDALAEGKTIEQYLETL